MTPIAPGTRVRTIYGVGQVHYARVNGATVEAYSVMLDHKVNKAGYNGTIVPAEHVSPMEQE